MLLGSTGNLADKGLPIAGIGECVLEGNGCGCKAKKITILPPSTNQRWLPKDKHCWGCSVLIATEAVHDGIGMEEAIRIKGSRIRS